MWHKVSSRQLEMAEPERLKLPGQAARERLHVGLAGGPPAGRARWRRDHEDRDTFSALARLQCSRCHHSDQRQVQVQVQLEVISHL
jgi:hypothetical protein